MAMVEGTFAVPMVRSVLTQVSTREGRRVHIHIHQIHIHEALITTVMIMPTRGHDHEMGAQDPLHQKRKHTHTQRQRLREIKRD